jgi:hypothetical protein
VGLGARERDAPATAGETPALRISVRPGDRPSAKGYRALTSRAFSAVSLTVGFWGKALGDSAIKLPFSR